MGTTGLPWQQQYDFNTSQSGDISTWTELTDTIPVSLVRTSSIVARGYVFLLGDFVTSGTYYKAPINADGTIGTWSSGSLGFSTYGFECVLAGNKIYILGDGTTTVRYATVNLDGTFSSWTTASSLSEARSKGRAIVIGSRMYYIGGITGTTPKNTVYYADLDSDNIIGSWSSSVNTLPGTRALGSLIFTGAKIYYFGGSTSPWQTQATGGYEAAVSGNEIGSWGSATYSPANGLSDASVAVSRNTAYIIGGASDGTVSPFVFYSSIDGSGNLGSWSYGTDLPTDGERQAAATIITSSRIYLIGGIYNSGNATKLVYASYTGGYNDYMGGTAPIWLYTC